MGLFKDPKNRSIFLLYLFSGFFFLSLETIWIRTVGLQIGSTVVSASLVISIYFFCAALGNVVASKILPRLSRSLRWYGWLEILCGGLSLVLFVLNPWLIRLFLSDPDTAYFISGSEFFYVFAMVGLPSFFSGATFPSISHVIVDHQSQRTQRGASPYGGNLWGAALGVILGGIYIPQQIGYHNTFVLCSLGLIAVGLLALVWKLETIDVEKKKQKVEADDFPKQTAYLIIFCSGLFSIVLEIVILVYFRQITGVSQHAVAAVLFSFIVNLGLGSLIAGRLRRKKTSIDQLLTKFLMLCAILCLVYPFGFYFLQAHPIFSKNMSLNVRTAWFIGYATLFLMPVLIFVGAIFPLAWETFQKNNNQQGQVFGLMSFVNKLGCAIGALLAPFVLFPWIGLPAVMMFVGCGYLLLFLMLCSQQKKSLRAFAVLSVVAVCCFVFRPSPVHMKKGEKLSEIYQGADGVIAVFEDENKSKHILFNQNYVLNGTQRSLSWQKQESWIPLILHANPQNVSFIGLASGISAAAALDFPISSLQAVELVPEVITAAREHFGQWNQKLFQDKRVSLVRHDGRQAIQASKENYDVIIITLLQPDQDGVSNLYSRNFFEIVRSKLSKDGIICLWLPFFQMDHELSGIIMRTFGEVFPHAAIIRGNMDPLEPAIGLVGSNAPIQFGTSYLENRLSQFSYLQNESAFLRSAANFQLLLVGDLKANQGTFQQYPLNTDDRPMIGFLGAKNIQQGGYLRGINYLNWADQKFTAKDFPSLNVEGMTAEQIERIIMASKNYYAARTYSVELPQLTADEQMSRNGQASAWYQKARELFPESTLEADNQN
jgi:spermidine synthase